MVVLPVVVLTTMATVAVVVLTVAAVVELTGVVR